MFINKVVLRKCMQDVTEKRLLFVTFLILLLGFFSASFTGLHHAGSSARETVYGTGVYSEEDAKMIESYIAQGEYKKSLDLNKDGLLNQKDRELAIALIYRSRVKRYVCNVGETKCNVRNNVLDVCQENEYKSHEWVSVPCEQGQVCRTTDKNFASGVKTRFAECLYPFLG